MKSKILFILHVPPPIDGASIIGSYIKENALINSTFDTEYINLTSAFTLETIGKSNLMKISIIFKILKKVYESIKNKKYDYSYMTLTTTGAGFYKDFLVVLLLKLFKVKIIFHLHNKGVLKNSKAYYNRLLYKVVFKNTKCILLSNCLYKDVKNYVKKKNVFICNNGIPNSEYLIKNTLIQHIEDSNTCKFLFLSNMMQEKGVFILLEATKKLQAKGYKFECHFVGACSDITNQFLKNKVEEFGIENKVHIHGQKVNDAKRDIFQEADVFVFPTYYHNECFPLVLIEAMLYSLPVISTPEGAISEMVLEGKTGLLTPQKNSDKLAEAMEYMLKHPKERIHMGIKGRKRYEEKYTISIFEQNIVDILNTVVKSSNKTI